MNAARRTSYPIDTRVHGLLILGVDVVLRHLGLGRVSLGCVVNTGGLKYIHGAACRHVFIIRFIV